MGGEVHPPNQYQDINEIVEIAKVAKKYNGIFNVHIRNESNNIFNAMKEVIEIGKKSGIPVLITHFKVAGKNNWGLSEKMLKLIDNAREDGVEVSISQYPYTAGSTMLHAVVPPWYHKNGSNELIKILKEKRSKIKQDIRENNNWENWAKNNGWNNIIVSYVKNQKNKVYEGKSIEEIASMKGIKDPADAALNLLIEEELAVGMIIYCLDDDDITNIMQHPSVNFITDGLLGGKAHPRLYGTYPKILNKYVKKQSIISLEEAIRKMTSLPAQKLRLDGKGIIRPKFDADITIFDFDSIKDNATYNNPECYPSGIEWVIVNGQIIVRNGEHTGARPGKVIRN